MPGVKPLPRLVASTKKIHCPNLQTCKRFIGCFLSSFFDDLPLHLLAHILNRCDLYGQNLLPSIPGKSRTSMALCKLKLKGSKESRVVVVASQFNSLSGKRMYEVCRGSNSGGLRGVWVHTLCGLTFELSGRRRQDAKPGPVKMYGVPPARAWWPAVGAPLERGVRPHSAPARLPYAQARLIFFFEAAQSRR
jgi:hypothetical protein